MSVCITTPGGSSGRRAPGACRRLLEEYGWWRQPMSWWQGTSTEVVKKSGGPRAAPAEREKRPGEDQNKTDWPRRRPTIAKKSVLDAGKIYADTLIHSVFRPARCLFSDRACLISSETYSSIQRPRSRDLTSIEALSFNIDCSLIHAAGATTLGGAVAFDC